MYLFVNILIFIPKRGLLMKAIHEIRPLLDPIFAPIIGDIEIKTYFSYYGIIKNGVMFALYKNGQLYLRKTKNTEKQAEQFNTQTQIQDSLKTYSNKHYPVTDDWLNSTEFSTTIPQIIADMQQELADKSHYHKTLIRHLPNMNITIERQLYKLGIKTAIELINAGEMNVFVELVKQGSDGTPLLLFRLYGAIHHQHIATLTKSQKIQLLTEANNALYQSGLRRRFKI